MSPDVVPHDRPEIATTASAVVYRNRWMVLREDAIARADGSTGIYGVVEKPDFAVVAAVRDGHVFLVEQYRYPVGERFWELPQGTKEGQQVDPLELAQAELREETGLVARTMVHAGRLFQGYGYSTQAYDVYLATDLEQHEMQLDVEEQGLVAKAFAIDAFEAMILDGTIRDASTVAAFGLLRLRGLL